MKMSAKQQYFQSIAQVLFSLRGAPFFLSTREIDLLEGWYAQNIPLKVVIEGIKLAYENSRSQPGKRRTKLYLNHCHDLVLRHFDAYKERKIGQQQSPIPQEQKRKRLQVEIRRFLAEVPEDLEVVKGVFEKIQKELSFSDWDENQLETYEDQIETLLWDLASPDQKQAVTAEIAEIYQGQDLMEADRLAKIKWIKSLRDKYKIPHISLFYY